MADQREKGGRRLTTFVINEGGKRHPYRSKSIWYNEPTTSNEFITVLFSKGDMVRRDGATEVRGIRLARSGKDTY